MRKPFWIPLSVAVGTIVLLYMIGFIANLDFLQFTLTPSYTEISLMPIVFGILIGFMTEYIIKFKIQK